MDSKFTRLIKVYNLLHVKNLPIYKTEMYFQIFRQSLQSLGNVGKHQITGQRLFLASYTFNVSDYNALLFEVLNDLYLSLPRHR